MLNWIKFTGLFVILLELPDFAHCDGNQIRGHRIYRVQVPKGYFEPIVQILLKGETEDRFEILHISRKLNDFVDVMVNPSSIKSFKKLIQEHNIHTKVIDCNVERSIRRFTAKNKHAAERKRFKRSANKLISHDFYMQFHELLSKDGNHLLKKYQFYIAPNVNPDGYVYSYNRDRFWRKNRSRNDQEKCPGTDLNRNFPYKWGAIDRFTLFSSDLANFTSRLS
ncbi:unnamed protein product [Hymenolepis diminuta]|uniref:Peptidase_M14 domain-containing protein n=1 Tax=Hymenolepis diminuta TaxID=6216 RepID=A0A158QE11_HYMDI|nr:unnamed protein product [Hymenolepis diminuta]